MTRLPQQPRSTVSVPAELVVGIARELEEVVDRIAGMKALCERQMTDLADASAAAADIAETLARRRVATETDPVFAALGAELSLLYRTVERQVATCQSISTQFLGVAREVELEIAALRTAAAAAAPGTGAPSSGGNVVRLRPSPEERDGAAAQAAAEELRRALRTMQDSTAALFRAQAESRRMVTALRRRMREHRRRTRDAAT